MLSIVDFKRAFDMVGRLYYINGKVFNVIKNMYLNVKSGVR